MHEFVKEEQGSQIVEFGLVIIEIIVEIGINFLNDEAGDGVLTSRRLSVSYAYHQAFDKGSGSFRPRPQSFWRQPAESRLREME